MLIRLGDLRTVIREEVFRNYMWSAGLNPSGIGGAGGSFKRGGDPEELELGTPEKDEEEEKEELPRDPRRTGRALR